MASQNVRRNTTAGAVTGGATGALGGAGVGALAGGSAGGPIGAIVGAVVGAVAGSVAGGVKAKNDAKNREDEVQRVEQREDTAIQRQSLDAQMAGIDLRTSEQLPTGSGSSSVEPIKQPEITSDMMTGFGQIGSNLLKQSALEQQLNLSSLELLFKGYDRYQQDSIKAVNDTQKEIDNLIYNFRTVNRTANEKQRETDEKIITSSQRLHQTLKSATFSDSEIKVWRDLSSGEYHSDTTHKNTVGGGGDAMGSIIAMCDNFMTKANEIGESATKENSDGKGLKTSSTTGENGDFKNKQNIVTQSSGEGNRNVNKTRSNDKNLEGQRKFDSKKKSKQLKLSASTEDTDNTGAKISYGSDNSRTENHSNKLTDDEINSIVKLYSKETIKKASEKYKTEFEGYDIESRMRFLDNLNTLYNKRDEYNRLARQSPIDYISPRWAGTFDLIKLLNFNR